MPVQLVICGWQVLANDQTTLEFVIIGLSNGAVFCQVF